MRRPTLYVLLPACVAIGALSSFRGDETEPASSSALPAAQDEAEGEHAEVVIDEPRHLRAPHNVNLFVEEDDQVRAPADDEWYERQSELEPDRWSYDEDLAEGQGGWVDSQGVYQLVYNEEEEEGFYWRNLIKEQLTRGRQDYVQFCSSCHGFDGDGYGRSAQHLRPGPRDFSQGLFKFAKVTQALPSDAALLRLIKRGLNGTPMLQWDLSDQQLDDIIQYIKTFSAPETGWRDLFIEIGDVVESGDDPWVGREQEAVTRGEKIYHKNECYSCHPGYATPARLTELREKEAGTKYRDDLSYPVLKDSSYTVLDVPVKILPPDFTWHTIRAGITPQDLFETIAAGIKGASMPQWKGSFPDEDIWAAAYYINHLITEYSGKPDKRSAFMNALRRDQ